MSDKLERDVEEVLAGIEDFDWRRRERRPGPLRRAAQRFGQSASRRLARLSPGHLMLAGSLLVIASFILPGQVRVWAIILGVVLFLIGIVWSARGGGRGGRGGKGGSPGGGGEPSTRGGYWRDRYISYDAPPRSPLGPLGRWFHRRGR